jgi:molybdate/tungstate transport system substrate-binding protein
METELRVYHAGNFRGIVQAAAAELRERDPDVAVSMVKGGSLDLVKQIAGGAGIADVVITADYRNIADFLYGKCTRWYGELATTSMVLAYGDRSHYADVISTDNWYEILSRPGVRIMGGDPDVDPGIYRRIMISMLAEKFYVQPGLGEKMETNVVAPDITGKGHAIPRVRAGQVDYAFMYKPMAAASGLRYIDLPPAVNLSDPSFRDFYASVSVVASGVRVAGDVIVYGVTVPDNAMHPEKALEFIEVLLGPAGDRIISGFGFQPVKPFKATGRVPQALRKYV